MRKLRCGLCVPSSVELNDNDASRVLNGTTKYWLGKTKHNLHFPPTFSSTPETCSCEFNENFQDC